MENAYLVRVNVGESYKTLPRVFSTYEKAEEAMMGALVRNDMLSAKKTITQEEREELEQYYHKRYQEVLSKKDWGAYTLYTEFKQVPYTAHSEKVPIELGRIMKVKVE